MSVVGYIYVCACARVFVHFCVVYIVLFPSVIYLSARLPCYSVQLELLYLGTEVFSLSGLDPLPCTVWRFLALSTPDPTHEGFIIQWWAGSDVHTLEPRFWHDSSCSALRYILGPNISSVFSAPSKYKVLNWWLFPPQNTESSCPHQPLYP